MEDEVYVIVTGHNLEAQCDVANVLIREKDRFQSFKCRENLMVESIFTANGKRLFIVATPPLNTPAWTRGEESINRFTAKVFLYIRDNDSVESDEQWFIRMLNERFGEQGRSSVLLVNYNLRNSDEPVKTDDSVLTDSKQSKQYFLESEIQFNKNDSFDLKTQIASKVFKEITEMLETAKVTFGGEMNVDNKRLQKQTVHTVSIEDESNLDTVEVPIDNLNDDEFKRMPLPTLTNEDWVLYRRTLRQGMAKTNHIRVIVIGNQGAGKTTLVKRLQDIGTECPDSSQVPTEGIEINHISTKCIRRDGIRKWKTKLGGYEVESNLQRMADAMRSVKQHSSEASNEISSDEKIQNEVKSSLQQMTGAMRSVEQHSSETRHKISSDDEILSASQDCAEEAGVKTKMQYKKLIDNENKVRFLKKAKLRLNSSKEETMYLSFWDFAGQTTYYSTHQAFLAPFAVYVLVLDLEQDLDAKICDKVKFNSGILNQNTVEETVKFWISSIKAYTRDTSNGHAPFIVVGTHKDKVNDEEITEKFEHLRSIMRKVSPVEYIAIDNTRPIAENEGLQDLREKILDLGIGLIDKEIPGQWIDLEHTIMHEKNKGCTLLSFDRIEKLDTESDVPMRDQKKIEAFLDHQHSIGWLMHFCHIGLKDFIILDPSMVANLFNIILSNRRSSKFVSFYKNKNGVVHQDFVNEAIATVFNITNGHSEAKFFFNMLTEMHIIHRYKRHKYFVPCLLSHPKTLKSGQPKESAQKLKLSFKDAYVPHAFFHLLLAALLGEGEKEESTDQTGTLKIFKKWGNRWIFNLFACFTYTRDSLWLKTYWENCSIFFEILNFSSEHRLVEAKRNKIVEIVTILEKNVDKVLNAYRQSNTKYLLEFECPKHKNRFVDLKKAREEYEAMCTDESPSCDEHAVSFDDLFHNQRDSKCKLRQLTSVDKLSPTEKTLGRLAKILERDTPRTMVLKLKLHHGNQLADQTCEQYKSSVEMQRLHILNTWMRKNPAQSLEDLLKRLTKSGDYTFEELEEFVTQEVKQSNWPEVETSLLQSALEDRDLVGVSECIGTELTFLMLELGLTIATIEQKLDDNKDSSSRAIYKLLLTWRDETDDATVRSLLDTAKFLNMNCYSLITKLKERRYGVRYELALHDEVED